MPFVVLPLAESFERTLNGRGSVVFTIFFLGRNRVTVGLCNFNGLFASALLLQLPRILFGLCVCGTGIEFSDDLALIFQRESVINQKAKAHLGLARFNIHFVSELIQVLLEGIQILFPVLRILIFAAALLLGKMLSAIAETLLNISDNIC